MSLKAMTATVKGLPMEVALKRLARFYRRMYFGPMVRFFRCVHSDRRCFAPEKGTSEIKPMNIPTLCMLGALMTTLPLTQSAQAADPVPSIAYTSESTSYHWSSVDGVKIFYREAGPKDAPTLVLLHGYPSSSRMWDSLIPLLADRYHIIAPDYPGFGRSDAPSATAYAYTFDHLAHSMGQLLTQLGINQYTLFMQDYGGPVGFRMILDAPQKLHGIIIQNANTWLYSPTWPPGPRYKHWHSG